MNAKSRQTAIIRRYRLGRRRFAAGPDTAMHRAAGWLGTMLREGCIALALCLAAAHAEVQDFYGQWENTAGDEDGLIHVMISPDGGNRVTVRAYGNCHPVACNWGQVAGRSYASGPHTQTVDSIAATFDTGLAKRQIIFRAAAGGRLSFELLTDFPDGFWQHDFVLRGTLKPSVWAGPIAENFERPAGSDTGWGGGARGAAAAEPQEACTLFFDPAALRTVQQNGTWRVTAGGRTLAATRDKQTALAAESAVKYFRFDRRCSVSGAADSYFKRGTSFPDQKMSGADCRDINPTTVHSVRIGRSWKVVDGNDVIAEFGDDQPKADALLSLIRFHRLDAQCFVGRPDPILTYWLSR